MGLFYAIVFLPLIGAILAGLISISGARARYPGGGVAAGAEDHAHDHGSHSHKTPPAHGAVIHDTHDETHTEGPPAAGSRLAEIITTSLLLIAAALSWYAFVYVGFEGNDARISVLNFITSGDLKIDWSIRVDSLTAVMLVVVTTVSALVHLYSIGYMADDPYRPRFFSYLSLFTFFMLALVTADNLVQLFFGWEGVGLASYLLIGFWYQKPSANAAAIKAFIVNRVGDFGFAIGIFALFMLAGSTDFETIFAQAPSIAAKTVHVFGSDYNAMTLICLALFMGAMGKSAQLFLHTWLPDAMEGPTPVSALIHAATMVTAGVFMVARLSPLFELAPNAQSFVIFIGGTTAFFAATVGLVQNDIKRIIAYSTCSQLGYMFVAMGSGAYSIGMFHLFTHAFFKALLFLGSGSVILAMHHEQDIRNMGGLKNKIPFTYAMMVIGTLALTGFPLTAGYFSKDAIIEAAYVGHSPMAFYGFLCTVVAALLTSFYSWRLIFKTFHGRPHDQHHYEGAHESPKVMLIPLAVLAIGAIFAGYPFVSIFAGHGVEEFFREALKFGPDNKILEEMHHIPATITFLPTVMMVFGFIISWYFYIRRPDVPQRLAQEHDILYRFLLNKWYFDEIYDFIFVRPTLWIGRLLWKGGDGWLIDGFGPNGVSARVLDVTRNVVRLQTGYLYHYAFAMLIGAAAFITWFSFAGAALMSFPILSLVTFLPLVGVLMIVMLRDNEAGARNARWWALWTTLITFGLSLYMLWHFDPKLAEFQFVEKHAWLATGISYHMGLDGISLPFVILTTALMPLCIISSWRPIQTRVREYMIAFLVLETLMIGTFSALDLVLFYLFFEGGLIPMFLIIGIWGGQRRVYASFKFFLYTLLGSVLMLLAIMAMYWVAGTTDIPTLMHTGFSPTLQKFAWFAFFASFAVKMPMWPVHTWLPDAHVEAPTAGSVILAAILLKMGGYGFLRFSIPMFPLASQEFAVIVFVLSVVAIVYTSLVALVQQDMKKLIAYSSVAHMGFVTMGIFALNTQAVAGAQFQMVSHGIVSAALFLCVGVVYDRMHTREIAAYGGLVNRMPLYAVAFIIFTLANVGLPGTSGFVGEFLTLLGTFKVNPWVAGIATLGVILSAAYALWLARRIIFGKLERPELAGIKDLDYREIICLAPLVVGTIFFGVYPKPLLDLSAASVEQLVENYHRIIDAAKVVAP